MPEPASGALCPHCQTPVRPGMAATTCPRCNTPHHYGCWREHNGCGVPACGETPTATPPPATPVAPPRAPQPTAPAAPVAEITPPAATQPAQDVPLVDPPPPEVMPLLDDLWMLIAEGRYADAAAPLAKAKELAPDHPAVAEVEGDLAFAQGRYAQAERCYRQAFTRDHGSTVLEEKYATTLVKVHEPEILVRLGPDTGDEDSLWSQRIPRPAWAAGLFSAILPGLGQFYNGDLLKGAGICLVNLIGYSYLLYPIVIPLLAKAKANTLIALTDIAAGMFTGAYLVGTLLLFALAVYSIVDAVLVARATSVSAKR